MKKNTKEFNEKIRKLSEEKIKERLITDNEFKMPTYWCVFFGLAMLQAFVIGIIVYKTALEDKSIVWTLLLAGLLLFQCKNMIDIFVSITNKEKCKSTIVAIENIKIIQQTTDEVVKNEEFK